MPCCLCDCSNKEWKGKERDFADIKEFNSFIQNLLNKICLKASQKSHFVLRCKEIKDLFIIKKTQEILSSLLKRSVEKFCSLHLEADTAILFLYSRIMGYYQTTSEIDPEDTDIVVISAYAASISNGKLVMTC